MSHEHFHCFVDMLLARPVHLGEMGGAIDGSVAEVRRLQDVNADMLDLAKNIAGLDDRYLDYSGILPDAVREWRAAARAAIAKAKGKS